VTAGCVAAGSPAPLQGKQCPGSDAAARFHNGTLGGRGAFFRRLFCPVSSP